MICEILLTLKLLGNTVPVGHKLMYPTNLLSDADKQMHIQVIQYHPESVWDLVEVQDGFLVLERKFEK